MKKTLTERQAWREIARRIAEGDWAQCGLCYEINTLTEDDLITLTTEAEMYEAIKYHMGTDGVFAGGDPSASGPWAFPSGDADVRVLAALFLAECAK